MLYSEDLVKMFLIYKIHLSFARKTANESQTLLFCLTHKPTYLLPLLIRTRVTGQGVSASPHLTKGVAFFS